MFVMCTFFERYLLESPQRADRRPPVFASKRQCESAIQAPFCGRLLKSPQRADRRPPVFASKRECESAIQAPFCGRLLKRARKGPIAGPQYSQANASASRRSRLRFAGVY